MNRRDWLASALGSALTVAGFGVSARDSKAGARALSLAWADYRARFIKGDGRVVDTGNADISHTEGQGTALLAAQYVGDRETFENVLRFTLTMQRPDGLFRWRWHTDQGFTDHNNATDGDTLIAWALLLAGERWSRVDWVDQGLTLVATLRRRCLVQQRGYVLLLPGADGFVSRAASGEPRVVVNPSYWVYPALRLFSRLDSPLWADASRSGSRLTAQALFGPKRLPADWLQVTDPPQPWSERPARFGYEAIRVPLYLVWDRQDRHGAVLSCARWFKEGAPPAWVELSGEGRAPYIAPPGFRSVASLVAAAQKEDVYRPAAMDVDYYSSSLTLLSLLAAQQRGWLDF